MYKLPKEGRDDRYHVIRILVCPVVSVNSSLCITYNYM